MKKPRPKFRVGQRVVILGTHGMRGTIVQFLPDIAEGAVEIEHNHLDQFRYWNIDNLRPLTAREVGPGWTRKGKGRAR